MNLGIKKAWAARIGAVVAVTLLGGVGAYAAGELAWYTGGNATVPDPDNDATLTFYNSSGAAITTGSTAAPFADFVASSDELRNGDNFASLYAYTPSSATAQGAWTGSQLSGTTKFAGPDAVAPTGSVPTDKPFVKGAASHQSLAQYIGANPNTSSASSLANVYELRLRTSSVSKGVGAAYASAFVKVTGATWTKVAAPPLGQADPVGTSVVLGARAITYGTATTIPVTVNETSGSENPAGVAQLFIGATKLSEATLTAAGTAAVPLPLAAFKTAVLPGNRALTVKFVPTNAGSFAPSEATKTYSVARRGVAISLTVTKLPTSRAAGAATIKVATISGLPAPTGYVQLWRKKVGSATIIKVSAPLSAGAKSFSIPKLARGTSWDLRAFYAGSPRYSPGYSAVWKRIRIAS